MIHQLWEIFVENVDPLSKVVHVPTLKPAFHKAVTGPRKDIPRNLEALMFAIYGTAIMSMGHDECQQRFSEPHHHLLLRYTRATEAALSRARFMGTTNLPVLQALCLHLLAIRDICEPRALYTLTGVAVRIAQVMGLERDGTYLGLSPFETEIRRRVWWQLKIHDFRTAELCGLAKFRDLDLGAERTKWPTNIDDDQLYPSMTSLMPAENKATDVLFVAFRCEMTEFALGQVTRFRKQGLNVNQWDLDDSRHHDKGEVENAVKELQDVLELKYLRYCDPSQPLHLLTMLVGRYGMNVVTFLTHHPRSLASMGKVSVSERQLVWDVSVKLLEQHNMVQTNDMLKSFSWHAPYFRQWHAFIHVLDTLRADPLKTDATKAWRLITSTYDNTPAMLWDMKKPIHAAIGNLCLKAYAAHEVASSTSNMSLPSTPDFIMQLRQWHEDVKAKRQARSAKSSRPLEPAVQDVDQNVTPRDPSAITSADEGIMSQPQDAFQPKDSNGGDTSYLFDGFDYGQVGDTGMEFDLMMPNDYGMADSSLEPINWEQWETWLAESNVMRS
ncbi:hypothetical protein BDW02DRAFT_249245 [Decorospora gaudefroyi]|uniref:Xylanolytic transcriptional activator regulatory domain-containing protein n=1 Tax=Decorospora gaudefroyi TaxID=184978 RepID=A0A6A5KRC8_9PLEO|nr:hypothetical protein BDW02DRAFT_249245 [Decorospora gaudefroyi]